LVPKAVSQFAAYLTAPGLQLPNGVAAFNSKAVSLVQTDFETAEKDYPIEAPVIKAHLDAARALIEVSKNLRDFDDNSQTDVWLAKFCSEQEQMVKHGPEDQRNMDGKMFLTFAEFAEVAKTNSLAASKYWTLSDIQLLEGLAIDAHLAVRQKLANLEAQTAATTSRPMPVPSSKTGLLTVKADDDTFEIFVDDSFVGNPPAKLNLSEGAHVIEVKKVGFKNYRREIKVTEGAELGIRAALEKQ
jgi:PEGA domain